MIENKTYGVLSIKYEELNRVEQSQIFINNENLFWSSDNILGLSDDKNNIVAIFEPDPKNELALNLVYLSSNKLPRSSDRLILVNLKDDQSQNHMGNTLLWKYKRIKKNYSQKYLPLFSQGSLIGDTAHSLIKNEIYVNTLGSLSYGINDWLTASANIPAIALGSPNLRFKSNVYNVGSQSWAIATSVAQERSSDQRLVNVDLIWDSVLTEKLIAHSMLSVAVLSFDEASGVAAIRSYGSSSIQTGYEILLDDWNRILTGPSYNVETESVGGYLSYIKFYKDFLIQFSITSNNLRMFKFSSEEGYLPYLELAWRW